MPDNSQKIGAIVLAAGKGVRMKSDLPKVVHKLGGRPMICYLVDALKKLSLDRTVIVIGYRKDLVIEALKGYDLEFAIQEKQLGTAHAVMMTEKQFANFQGNIFVLLGDVPFLAAGTLQDLLSEHLKRSAVATVLTSVPPDPSGYGRVIRKADGLVEKIVEHKDTTASERKIGEINSGTFVFQAKELFAGLKLVTNENSQGEYYLTDLMEIFRRQGKVTAAYQAPDYRETLGVNSLEQLKELERTYNLVQLKA